MKRFFILFVFVLTTCISKLYAQNEFHFNGTLSELWSDASNWKDGLKPDGEHTVIFLHASVRVDENVVVDDLLYTNVSAVVTVAKDCLLTVKGALAPLSDQQLIVEDGAQLVCGHEVSATVCKKISPYDNAKEAAAWHFIASPITEALLPTDLDSLVYEDANYELMRFNQSNVGGEWERYKDEAYQDSFYLNNGQGYLYVNGSEVTVSFAGRVQASNQPLSLPLEYDGASNVVAKGFNLVGNPFTCEAYVDRSFYRMNSEGTDIELVRASANEAIKPCTGVIVQTLAAGQEVSFNPFAESFTDKGCIRLTLSSNGNVVDNAMLSFNEGEEIGKFNFTEHTANLYFTQNGMSCAIGTAETSSQTSVHFRTDEDGNFVLNVTPEGIEVASLWLVDNKTGADVNLLANPNYSFSATTNDYSSRFKLFVNTDHGIAEGIEAEPFAYFSPGNIIVSEPETMGKLQVIDLLGHVVMETTVDGCVAMPFSAASGVYVLRLTTGKGVRMQKIVL